MINRITSVEAPGNGRRRASPDLGRLDRKSGSAWDDLGERVERYIGDHPVLSLAIGFSVGIVVGCLIKRR